MSTLHGSGAALSSTDTGAQRGQPDKAFHWLDHAVATRDPGVLGMRTDPFLARYKHDPRYLAFARKLGLIGHAASAPAAAASTP